MIVSCESASLSKISKLISVRVLDGIYDNSKIEVPDEFHYAGKDLTAAINIRGFTKFQNIDLDWTILDKKGVAVPEEKIVENSDATVTIKAAESNDYTITANYEGIKLDSLTVQVRAINLDAFLRTHIWWIMFITVLLIFFTLFFRRITRRSRTTVENIERVYDVFTKCLADDTLSSAELVKIKKEITKCLHRCEDLNIDALNQYEKSIRYLRKSLGDIKVLINSWDTLSPSDKGVYIDQLDKDLGKALGVAKEIEDAKKVSDEYHVNANRSNYEVLTDDKDSKK